VADVVYLIVMLALFAATAALVPLFERLRR
jgi:hypothetical protein